MRFVEESEVAAVLRMEDLIPAMRRAMIDFSQGHALQPVRRIMPVEDHGGFFGAMPAVTPDGLGAKFLTFYPENKERGLSTHMALVALFDPETGEPLVVMDGKLITEMRPAAVTAAYVDAVAPRDARSLAILGAGRQGRSHIDALSQVRPLDDIRIWSRTKDHAEELADQVAGESMSCEHAVLNADIVIAATGSQEPILDGAWLKQGAKVASVGWSGVEGAALDRAAMSNVVIVDSREGTHAESGNIRRYHSKIYAELGEVLDGRRPVNADDTVVFDSVGMACQDIAAARLVYDKLRQLGQK